MRPWSDGRSLSNALIRGSMTADLHTFFAAAPLAAIALALALGYLCGKIRLGTFVLGPVAATLLVAIVIGQVGVNVSGPDRLGLLRPADRVATRDPLEHHRGGDELLQLGAYLYYARR